MRGRGLGVLLVLAGCPQGSTPVLAGGASDRVVFSVEYRSVTRHPTCLGNHRVKVDAQGRVFQARNDKECTEKGQRWSAPYPAQPARTLSAGELAALAQRVRRAGFFELPAQITDPRKATTGGRVEEIEVQDGERRHQVSADNKSLPAFDEVRQLVLGKVQ